MKIERITGSSPINRTNLSKEVLKHKPKEGETSLQRYDGTNVCQWHYRTKVFWHETGPLFAIEDNT